MLTSNLSRKKRIRNELLVVFLILILLIIRIGWLQFIQGNELKSEAYAGQVLNRSINPERGTIYDSSGEVVLAMSSTVETVTINQLKIEEENKEKVANAFVDIFELDYETVMKKLNKKSSIEIITKKVDKEKSNALRKWMIENNITVGINIDEDTKRYYPYNSLASHVIGFTGSDNQGLDGIEAKYEEELKGRKGYISKITDARGGEIENALETYNNAIDGNDLVLSIDVTIQSIVEKYLKKACIDNVCTDGGNIIVMNPKTGDILAMSTYPEYNLNSPYEPTTEELKTIWDTLSSSDKSKELTALWRNKAVADAYEPGSTFKLITSSAAIEEGIADPNTEGVYNCSGSIEIAGVRIKCWRHYRPHGSQSLRTALMNSCNPVFIGLGQKIGVEKYYDYLEKFGLLKITGIDLPGEGGSIFLKEEKVGPVELATISFGQRFEITPIQMVTAVSAIANRGIAVKPRVVKAIIDSQTGERRDIEVEERGEVISEKTANSVLSMMQSVVDEGTGKNAKVAGYSIGGKTGTSEDGVNTGKYVTSFIGVAPIEAPELVILITLYNPTGEGGHQGGGVAAPIAGEILGEVLPYLEVQKVEEVKEIVTVPNVTGLKIKEAREVLKEAGLELKAGSEEISEEQIIEVQTPKEGINLTKGTAVLVE